MRSRNAIPAVLILLAGTAVLLWLQRESEPHYRDVRPPTPVSDESVATPVSDAPGEEAPVPDDSQAPVAPNGAESNACEERFSDQEKPSREEIKEILSGAMGLLRTSGSREHMLAAVSLDRGLKQSDAEELVAELDSLQMHDPLALWTKLTICESARAIECDFAVIEASIRRHHSGNSAFWMAIVGHHLAEGREELALDAMRMVVGAPDYDSYLAEQYLNIDRALAASTNWSPARRAVEAVEVVAVSPPGLASIMSKCKRLDTGWDALCDQLAERLSADADEIMARGFGAELQVALYEARNGGEGASELREELQSAAFGFMQDEERLEQAINALLNDETLLRMFFENLESYGEIKAFERLVDDVERLRKTEGYDQCNFVGNPFVQL